MKFIKKIDWLIISTIAFILLMTVLFIFEAESHSRWVAKNKASRPGVEATQNVYTSCVGNNLVVAEYDHYGSVEPKNVQVFQNNSSCTGGDL